VQWKERLILIEATVEIIACICCIHCCTESLRRDCVSFFSRGCVFDLGKRQQSSEYALSRQDYLFCLFQKLLRYVFRFLILCVWYIPLLPWSFLFHDFMWVTSMWLIPLGRMRGFVFPPFSDKIRVYFVNIEIFAIDFSFIWWFFDLHSFSFHYLLFFQGRNCLEVRGFDGCRALSPFRLWDRSTSPWRDTSRCRRIGGKDLLHRSWFQNFVSIPPLWDVVLFRQAPS